MNATKAYAVLWWVPQGHYPSAAGASERLEHLKKFGAAPHVFTFKDAFPAPDAQTTNNAAAFDDSCPAT